MAFLMAGSPYLNALVVRTYNPEQHNRFLNFPSNPSHNPNFIYSGINLTGSGWYLHASGSQRRGITMVSPIHFVGANHAKPGVGSSLSFLSTGGIVRTYTTASQSTIPNGANMNSDLLIGKLTAPILAADEVRFHPYLNLSNTNAYKLKSAIILGIQARGGTQKTINIFPTQTTGINQTQVISTIYTKSSGNNDDAHLENGDSGSPLFINEGGVAAIIGIHSLVSTSPASSVITNYSTFIPHYIDELNSVMEADGYRMTKAIPGSTTLTLNHQLPTSLIRAGHDFNINLILNNTGPTLGENIKLTNRFPPNTQVTSASGVDWFDESTNLTNKARKASLPAFSFSNYSITLNIPTTGTVQHEVTYACDQFTTASEVFDIEVIESFASWTSALTDKTNDGDDDNDGISNLLEYAFGGIPTNASRMHPNTNISLLPHHSNDNITYIRRTDATQRALTYQLTTSTTLKDDSWSDASAMISNTTTTPISPQFEQVTLELTNPNTERFFRVEVTLNE